MRKTVLTTLICLVISVAWINLRKHKEPDVVLKEAYWWPLMKAPKGIIECNAVLGHGDQALAQSLAGLMAKSVNSGKTDELIWILESNPTYEDLYQRLKKRLNLEIRGRYDVWDLLKYCESKIVIPGYIVYKEPIGKTRESLDQSYNVACMYAGINNAVLIEEKLENKAKDAGLKMLVDARTVSVSDCFESLKNKLDNSFITTMNPRSTNIRDFAIAYNSAVVYGVGDVTEKAMKWIRPVSPVLGWNTGGESTFTMLPSKYGLFNTASDMCRNLVVLSANSINENLPKVKVVDPSRINFNEGNHFHSFIMSDGDNMQWSIGGFIYNKNYWASPYIKELPVGFTSCPMNLSMMAPDAYDALVETQSDKTSVIEYGGGYQYPDLFASALGENAEKVQREFARKINVHMKRTGTRVFGFIVIDIDSESALNAYKIYAEEIDDLVGMVAVQYAPYHGGKGEVFWVRNKNGIEIPVMTAKYALWKDLTMMPERAGDPATLPAKINKDVSEAQGKNERTYSWTSVHAWSRFGNPKDSAEIKSGVSPIKWCSEGLSPLIKVVSPEELLWRLRMEHNPAQTIMAIKYWEKN